MFNIIFLVWVLLKPSTKQLFVVGDDLGQALGWLLATLFCFVDLKPSWRRLAQGLEAPHTPQHWVPLLFAAGIFCQLLGQMIYTYYDMHHWNPSLSRPSMTIDIAEIIL